MYQRRKVLLALIEVFGETLKPIDCYKLMFLLCLRTGHNYYDFFPYKYGAFSFVLYQDKLRLTDLGYLQTGEQFSITSKECFFPKLDMFTQSELRKLASDMGSLKGDDLLRKVYVEYPHYAIRSTVAQKILKPKDYKAIKKHQNKDHAPRLFTIGYEGISIDKYLDILISNNISTLVDVRKNPISRKYGFSKQQLQRYVENSEITYIHLPQLGIPSNMRHNLDNEQAYTSLFQHYVDAILPEQQIALNHLKEIIYNKNRVALTCFEATHTCCHRSKVTEYFENDPSFNIPVEHLDINVLAG